MAASNTLVLPYDNTGSSFAPATGKQGAAAQSPQGGLVSLGNDYSGTPGNLFAPRVSSSGYQYTVASTANAAGTVYPSAQAPGGSPMQALQGLTQVSVQADAQGQLLAAPLALPTFTAYASPVTTANGKSMLALMNKSSGTVIRLMALYAQNSAISPSSMNTYYVYVQQIAFITGLSGGTAVTPVSHDTADSLASGITLASAGTVSGEATTPIRRWVTSNYPWSPGASYAEVTTGDEQGRFPWHYRVDPTTKPVTIRPGYGVHLKIASTADNGAQNVTMVFTQASV